MRCLICPGLECCTYVALAADHLVAVELGGKSLERGLNDTTTKSENQVESGLLYIRSALFPMFSIFLPLDQAPAVPFQRTFWML